MKASRIAILSFALCVSAINVISGASAFANGGFECWVQKPERSVAAGVFTYESRNEAYVIPRIPFRPGEDFTTKIRTSEQNGALMIEGTGLKMVLKNIADSGEFPGELWILNGGVRLAKCHKWRRNTGFRGKAHPGEWAPRR